MDLQDNNPFLVLPTAHSQADRLLLLLPTAIPAVCHTCPWPYLQSVIPVHGHTCCTSYLPKVIPAVCHTCPRPYLLSVIPAHGHTCCLSYLPTAIPAFRHTCPRPYLQSVWHFTLSPVFNHSQMLHSFTHPNLQLSQHLLVPKIPEVTFRSCLSSKWDRISLQGEKRHQESTPLSGFFFFETKGIHWFTSSDNLDVWDYGKREAKVQLVQNMQVTGLQEKWKALYI